MTPESASATQVCVPRLITTTATHVAAHPTQDGGSTGLGREKCHVGLSGYAQPGPMADPATRRSLTSPPSGTGSECGPQASSGQRLSPHTSIFHWVFWTIRSLTPHLRPICLGRPYWEHMAPDNLAPRFIGTHKPHRILETKPQRQNWFSRSFTKWCVFVAIPSSVKFFHFIIFIFISFLLSTISVHALYSMVKVKEAFWLWQI